MEIQHFSHLHPLIFIDALEIDSEKEVVCLGCDELILGAGYKCFECTFFLHKSCAELPRDIRHHLDSNHTLVLQLPSDKRLCDACNKSCVRSFFYQCEECDFDLDIKCASLWPFSATVDGHQHTFVPILKQMQHFSHQHPLIFIEALESDGEKEIVCSGCDEPVLGAGYNCSACSFFLHKSCAELQWMIQHLVHPNHTLVLRRPSKNELCYACFKSCQRCFFYHCKSCNFALDIKCFSSWRINSTEDCHHAFITILKQIQFTCEICGEECNGTARICSICLLLIVHPKCAELPRTIKIVSHGHFLTLTHSLHQVKKQDRVLCKFCYKTVNTKYAVYYCQKCDFVAHLKCAKAYSTNFPSLSEINSLEDEGTWDISKDFGSRHNFILTNKELEDDKFCYVCMQLISGRFYTCYKCSGQCNMFIHDRCGKLPRKKRHRLHPHLLTLCIRGNYCDGAFYCTACRHFRHGFTYRCDECYYYLDIHCSSIPETLKHEAHQHSLFLAIRSIEKCNGCDSLNDTKSAYVCIESECDFALGIECAILPLVAKYEYDKHLLKLTYKVEDDSGEYYCFICEEERNPNQWFYYCAECDFAAHPRCVLGQYPYIKYGITYVEEESHQHPVTIVRKTKESPSCDICRETFDGVAIECTQCKFLAHWWGKRTCFWKIKKKYG